jgi:hypothetical protein
MRQFDAGLGEVGQIFNILARVRILENCRGDDSHDGRRDRSPRFGTDLIDEGDELANLQGHLLAAMPTSLGGGRNTSG